MVSMNRRMLFGTLADCAAGVATRAAGWSLRVPALRNYFLDRLFSSLAAAQADGNPEPEAEEEVRILAPQLRCFIDRLIQQRPAAARAIVRFVGTWVSDCRRRHRGKRAGRAAPATVVIEPTDRCNLNCPGCYANSLSSGNDLPYEALETIVDQVVDMGVTLITISGGEPMLREKEDQVLTRLARKHPNRGLLVYTNGTLIDEEIADRLAKVGNVFPAISVEGFEHQTDQRRGRGIYEQNRRARRLLAERGVMCGFSATITSENAEAICTDEFMDLRIAEGDLFGWFFLMQPIGRNPRMELMVSPEQRALLRQAVRRWRQQKRPIFLGDFWNDGPLVGGCIAGGRYYFHVYANGDISPCVFSPISCGNVLDIDAGKTEYADLADFVDRNPVFAAYRREQSHITDRARPCLLIDHPESFRRVCCQGGWKPAKNMAEGYLDGQIADELDTRASAWHHYLCQRACQPEGTYVPQTASTADRPAAAD